MAKVTVDMPTDAIKDLLAQLSPAELHLIVSSVRERLETVHMMRFAESAFAEWEQEEDLYSHG